MLLVQELVGDEVVGGAEQQGVAVGRGARDIRRADVAAGTGLVVDDEALAETLLDRRCDGAESDVARAAGCVGNHQPDRLARPLLRVGEAAHCGQCERGPANERNAHGIGLHWLESRTLHHADHPVSQAAAPAVRPTRRSERVAQHVHHLRDAVGMHRAQPLHATLETNVADDSLILLCLDYL